ncbi:MAG: glycosyltransferase [Leptospirales bacterium]
MIPVLYIIDNLRQGGSQRYVSELARFGERFGVEPHVCSFEEGGHFYDEIRTSRAPLLSMKVGKVQDFSTIAVIRKLMAYIRNQRIQVIHTFQTKANIIGTMAGVFSNTKVITSRRDVGDFSLRGSRKLVFFERVVINRLTDMIMVNSKAVQKAALLEEKIPGKKLQLIYNTVDLERFHPGRSRSIARKKLGLGQETIAFGSVAGFRHVKGVDILIRAAGILSRQRRDFRVFIAGDGPERANLEDLVLREGVSDRIVFLGHMTEIEELNPGFDVFVLTSRSEGCSNAILEAQASGLPVIATNVGGNPEIILNGETGILVPTEDPAALAEAMNHLASDGAERLRLGQHARQFIENHFSQDVIHSKLGEMYRSLLR